jgi:hypothetical protein
MSQRQGGFPSKMRRGSPDRRSQYHKGPDRAEDGEAVEEAGGDEKNAEAKENLRRSSPRSHAG